MTLEEIVASDQRILAATQRSVDTNGTILTFDWGDGSPPLQGQAPERMEAAMLIEWCQTVRGNYNARQASKAAEKAGPPAVVQRTHGEVDSTAGLGGGSGLPDAENVQSIKTTMEGAIQASIAQLVGRRDQANLRRETLQRELSEIETYTQGLSSSIDYYLELMEKL